jgi:hypothetical protein
VSAFRDPVHALASCAGQALKHLPVAGPLKEAKGHVAPCRPFDPVHGVSLSQVVHALALWQALKHLPVAGPLKEAKGHVAPSALFETPFTGSALARSFTPWRCVRGRR